jgi:hypothetical protein
VAWETFWFLRLTWSGDAMHGTGCGGVRVSWWFFLQGVSPASLQDFTLGSTLSASSLQSPSWNLSDSDLCMPYHEQCLAHSKHSINIVAYLLTELKKKTKHVLDGDGKFR